MSIFVTTTPQFEAFLARAKDDTNLAIEQNGASQNARFIPRNFLIEEHLDPSRAGSYAIYLPSSGPSDFAEWNNAHNKYLERHVFVIPRGVHDYRFVSPDNPDICPETFRAELALIRFKKTDLDTHFIRIIPVADLAYLSGENEARIFSLGERAIENTSGSNLARQELSLILEDAFAGARCDHRPVFAAFYEDFLEELRQPADTSWPNHLRDRLGLYHINQWQTGGLPRRVFLFRYSVRDIPRHPGDPNIRPVAVPAVLDHKLSVAFCPVPHELDRGHLLNLQANAVELPAREVLHLFMPMQVEHLFRVGHVTTPVPEDLTPARRDHLIWMRLQANRDNYAADTDDDLF